MGGPDVPENKVATCATGHQNIHRLLSKLVDGQGVIPWGVERSFHPGERKYARLGYERSVRGSL
jgi:hypothetical protein